VEENTIAANAVPAPAPVETPAPPAEPTPTEPVAPIEPAEPQETRAEKRIKQLVAKQREAERQAEYWRGVASQGKQAPTQPAAGTPPAPTVDQFEAYDDFLVAKAKHEIRTEQAANEQKARISNASAAFAERINKAAEKEPEILEIVNDPTLPISEVMGFVIKESEAAPDILKYLSEHRDESLKLTRMTPASAAREIGKIEYKILNQPKTEIKKVSQAPEPIKPIEPKGPQSIELDKMPMEDFFKKRNQEQFGAKRR
jgi:hypothetical protein